MVVVESSTTLESQPVELAWPRSAQAAFWLLHPRESDFDQHPPCKHRSDGEINALSLLEAAIDSDVAHQGPGPTFFVVPELTVCPTEVDNFRRIVSKLPSNRVAIVGLGHLTKEQCDELESGVGSERRLWRRDWGTGRYANAAAVCVGGKIWLEAKDWPSKMEDDAACHLPHSRVRVFRGHDVSFAVMICSEVLANWSPDAFLRALARERVDVLFWIQHNPKPRHDQFRRGLGFLYETVGDTALVVAANKQPRAGKRAPYGVSAMYAPSVCFARRKENLLRPNFAVEPLGPNSGVTRAVFIRYDVPAHQILTIHPGAVPKENAPADFLREVVPYEFRDGALTPDDTPKHFQSLFQHGRAGALGEAGLSAPLDPRLTANLLAVEQDLENSANQLMNFLDTALLQENQAAVHANHESHVLAAECDCWKHREDFDSLFETSMAAAVAEMTLAIAAIRTAGKAAAIEITASSVENLAIAVGGTKHRVLLASSSHRFDEFWRRFFARPRTTTRTPTTIVLKSERRTLLPANASQAAPTRDLNAANVQPAEPATLVGSEFWKAFHEGRLAAAIDSLLLEGG